MTEALAHIKIVVLYEEIPEDDESEADFQNKINLRKKYDSNAEPKLHVWSVE